MSHRKPKIGIVISSTREGRFGENPAHWIYELAGKRGARKRFIYMGSVHSN